FQECRNPVSDVIAQALGSVEEASETTAGPCRRSSEIKQVQGTARDEYPPRLEQSLGLLVAVQVVEHEGGEHAIEGTVRIRQHVGEPTIELYREHFPLGLSPGAGERFGIGIEPDHFGPWLEAFDEKGQVPGTAANFENPVTRPNACLLEK